jgi:hypothetical protein
LPEKVKGLYLHHYEVDRHILLYKDGLFRQDIMTGWASDNASEDFKRPVRDREKYKNLLDIEKYASLKFHAKATGRTFLGSGSNRRAELCPLSIFQ